MRISILIAFVFFQSFSFAKTNYEQTLQKLLLSKEKDSVRLEKLFKSNWQYLMETNPEWATYVGYPGQNANWSDQSPAAIAKRKKTTEQTLKVTQSIRRKNLQADQVLSYDLFLKNTVEAIESAKFQSELMPLDQMAGVQVDLADILLAAPRSNKADYDDILARLEKAPLLLAQTQALMEEGLRRKITQPKVILKGIPAQFAEVLKEKVEESPLYLAFVEINKQVPEQEQKEIRQRAKAVIENKVYPSLKSFRDFVVQKYIPQSRESISFSDLPEGSKWYAFKVKLHTTISQTPDEIHNLGLQEVKRIRLEMEKVKESLKFQGDLKKFNEFLKTDKRFFFQDSKEMMTGYREISKRIDAELPRFFGKMPRLPYGVREMPSYKAPSAPTAYYQGGSLESGRAGFFEANTYDLGARPKWQMEALTLHEAVPGHHLQIALAQEITGFPDFRKQSGPTAYIEGWGLYAESLGEDFGLYTDPYSKYGQLTYEMWRAVRLVVDTGLHSKNWTREQVMQYFRDNTPISEQQIMNETDRYIAMPGQALAYKIGELKFKELRQIASAKLQDKFSIREFHDALLSDGALPMDLLEKKMQEWLEAKMKTHKKVQNKISL